VGISNDELQIRMAATSLLDHLGGEVDADAFRRRERRQQIPLTASDLQNAKPTWNKKLVDPLQTPMIRAGEPPLALPGSSERIPVRDAPTVICRGVALPRTLREQRLLTH
jgi:hypothetical protein